MGLGLGVRVRRWDWAKWDWANWDWAKWDWAKWGRTDPNTVQSESLRLLLQYDRIRFHWFTYTMSLASVVLPDTQQQESYF